MVLSRIIHLITLNLARKQKFQSINTTCTRITPFFAQHRSNKSYNKRLSRWIDRLLPYNFTIEHMPGAKMGLVDYVSRIPYARAKQISTYDEHFVVSTISKIRDSMKHLITN